MGDAIKGNVADKKAEDAEMKAKLNKMKNTISYTSEDAIDKRIEEIEFKVQTESLSLKDEKALLLEIKELKKTKPKLSQFSKLQDSVANLDSGKDLKERSKELAEVMQSFFNQKVAIQERLKALNEKREKETGDISVDYTKRDDIQKKIQELVTERSALRDAFKAEMTEYKAYQAEQRRIRNEKYQEERKAQDAA